MPLRRIGEDGTQFSSWLYQFLATRDHMLHQASPGVRPEHAGYVLEGTAEGSQTDNTPIGTYVGIKTDLNVQIVNDLHPVRFLY
jgi:hypothetical protein